MRFGKMTAVAIGAVITLSGAIAVAEEGMPPTEKKPSLWTMQVGYSPMFLAASFVSEDDGVMGVMSGPVHGGAISFDWRGKGRWGVQIPIDLHAHKNSVGRNRETALMLGLGVNALAHFCKQERSVDPYAILGGRVMVSFNSGKTNALPIINLGVGVRGFVSKHVGLFAEAIASPFVLPPFAAGALLEGRAGVSVRF